MEDALKYIITFISGGLAGAVFNHLVAKNKNKVQKLCCYYIEDETISKLPVAYGDTTHENLQSKKFLIENTTNRDIEQIKVVFEFESQAFVSKWKSYSKAGADIPKGRIYEKKNECNFLITNFNRDEKIEIYLEISNIINDRFNITELNVTGVKIKYVDKRKRSAKKIVKMVEKRELSAVS